LGAPKWEESNTVQGDVPVPRARRNLRVEFLTSTSGAPPGDIALESTSVSAVNPWLFRFHKRYHACIVESTSDSNGWGCGFVTKA
jgi:hypothetical protein